MSQDPTSERVARSARERADESGRGFFGFLIALVAVVLLFMSLRAFYVVKHKADLMDAFSYEVIQNADRMKWTVEDVKAEIIKKGSELGIVLPKADRIEVLNDTNGWKLRFEFEDTVFLPGFSFRWKTTVDKGWTRF